MSESALAAILDSVNLIAGEDEPLSSLPLDTDGLRTRLNQLRDPFRSHLLDFWCQQIIKAVEDPERVVAEYYEQIRRARENVARLACGRLDITASVAVTENEGKYEIGRGRDAFLDAIEGAKFGHVRRCPVCSRFFYASQANQYACHYPPGKCAAALRKRNQRIALRALGPHHLHRKPDRKEPLQ